MRTVTGLEAVALARRFHLPLLDTEHGEEIQPDQAQELIRWSRTPEEFVIENWPDDEDEADAIVLNAFQRALWESRWCEVRLQDLQRGRHALLLHTAAAEQAVERLVQQHRLELVGSRQNGAVFRMPKTVRLSQTVLHGLRGILCPECARLDLDAPFHDACLIHLIEYLKAHEFTIDDIEQADPGRHEAGKFGWPSIRMLWLSRTTSSARAVWQDRVSSLFGPRRDRSGAQEQWPQEVDPQEVDPQQVDPQQVDPQQVDPQQVDPRQVDPPHAARHEAHPPQTARQEIDPLGSAQFERRPRLLPGASADTMAENRQGLPLEADSAANARQDRADVQRAVDLRASGQSPRVSKEQLLQYLQEIEIVDNVGEFERLRQEEVRLQRLLTAAQRDREQAARRAAQMTEEADGLRGDLDILIEAMRIARQHRPESGSADGGRGADRTLRSRDQS